MNTPRPDDPTERHRALSHPRRVQLLRLLEEHADGLDATALAAATGLHPNTVRVHMDKLVVAGLVRSETVHAGGRGRPPNRYLLEETASDESRYRLLSSMLASALATGEDGPSPIAEAAGRRWGRQLIAAPPADATAAAERDPTRAVTVLFDRLGFAPAPEDDRIVLHACPYRELAREHPDVICGLHLGLLRGALDVQGRQAADGWLEPFVTPTRCHAGLLSSDPRAEERS
jgi:predicted ArsR family transcriptional regulator